MAREYSDQRVKLSESGQGVVGLDWIYVCPWTVLLPHKLHVGGRAVRSSEMHDCTSLHHI